MHKATKQNDGMAARMEAFMEIMHWAENELRGVTAPNEVGGLGDYGHGMIAVWRRVIDKARQMAEWTEGQEP